MYNEDTIAAISTPHGTGGIGIIRISGPDSFDIAQKIFKGKKRFEEMKSHTISYGKIVDPSSGETLDEVLITKMQKPHTFTTEDVVEINCHGGMVVLKNILELVIKQGARLAEPGEFSKRAFLNGRLDLSQAEAIIDLINSKTERSSKIAVRQLEGKLSAKIREIKNILIELIAHIEVTVDYPEDDIEEITGNMVYNRLKEIQGKLRSLLDSYENGRILREGVDAVIVGKPNVGKSSLLNELSGKNRAIVTDIPGTTRDIIEEYININGIPLRLLDTAGIRETEDVVEKIGVERTKKAIEDAQLLIVMIDAGVGMDEEEKNLLKKLKDRKVIVVINKVDAADGEKIKSIEAEIESVTEETGEINHVRTSLKTGVGIDELINTITGLFISGNIDMGSEEIVSNIRHKNLIEKALHDVTRAMDAHESGMPLDMMTIDIRSAAENLGLITGESISEDVANEIFSKFCLGK